MIGRLDPQSKDVTVVGAGISGLLAAYHLDRAGYGVTLIDAAEREGGLISTSHSSLGLIELAAHSVPATPTIRELCSDLGVELCPIRSESRARFIYRHKYLGKYLGRYLGRRLAGKPRRFPLKFRELVAMFLRAYFVIAPARDPESLTLEEWARRFLGTKALRYLLTPFVRGIYGASPAELSVSAAFPGLCVPRGHSLLSFLLAKKWRRSPPSGVKRAIRRFPRGEISAPREGMQALTDALGRRLKEKLGERFQRGVRLESLPSGNLILCVPASEAAKLLSRESPELSEMLAKVRYSSLTTATVFAESRAFRRTPRGLGVLVPDGEGRKCLGILYNSSAFPGRVTRDDLVSLTVMMGAEISDSEMDATIRSELREILDMKGDPLEIHARRWERAIPKYDGHLLKTWECAERTWCATPGHVLFGNYTGQVSIRGMAELARELNPRTA